MKRLLHKLTARPAARNEALLAALGGERCDTGSRLQGCGVGVTRAVVTECRDQASPGGVRAGRKVPLQHGFELVAVGRPIVAGLRPEKRSRRSADRLAAGVGAGRRNAVGTRPTAWHRTDHSSRPTNPSGRCPRKGLSVTGLRSGVNRIDYDIVVSQQDGDERFLGRFDRDGERGSRRTFPPGSGEVVDGFRILFDFAGEWYFVEIDEMEDMVGLGPIDTNDDKLFRVDEVFCIH